MLLHSFSRLAQKLGGSRTSALVQKVLLNFRQLFDNNNNNIRRPSLTVNLLRQKERPHCDYALTEAVNYETKTVFNASHRTQI